MELEAAKAIGAGLAMIALFGVGLAIGNVFVAVVNAVARNPEVRNDVQAIGLLGFALTEATGLFALLIAFLILFAL